MDLIILCLYGSLDQPNSPPPEMFRAAASHNCDGAPRRASRKWYPPAGKVTAARLRGRPSFVVSSHTHFVLIHLHFIHANLYFI